MASERDETAEVPEGGGSVSFERIRLYLERHPDKQEFGKVDYDDGYVGEDWPHRGYALARKDIEALLEDCDIYNSEVMDAQSVASDLREQKRQWLKDKAEAERLRSLVHSMRLNGARHHFVFAYDKYVEAEGRRVQFCKECDKDKGHPAHFHSGSRYLDSREVEKQAEAALKRVVAMLEGMHLPPLTAQNTARELLAGLPGVPEPIEPEEGNA